MALRAVSEHPKFYRLKLLLGTNKACTLGYLEGLWHFCGRFTPTGAVGKYADAEIEAWLEWDGERGALIAAYVTAGWLDRHPVHRLLVHDWARHADDGTKKALKRANLEAIPTPSASVATNSGQVLDIACLPDPDPDPDPVPEPEPVPKAKAPVTDKPSRVKVVDPRHALFKAELTSYWTSMNPGLPMPWDGSDAKCLSLLLSASPDLNLELFTQLLRHRAASEETHCERTRVWLGGISKYANGPLDKYGNLSAASRHKAPRVFDPGVSIQSEMSDNEVLDFWREAKVKDRPVYATAPGDIRRVLDREAGPVCSTGNVA